METTRGSKERFRAQVRVCRSLFALLAQRDAAENQRTRDRHGERERLAEHHPRPHDAEQRHEVRDGGSARRAYAIDQPEVEPVGDAGAEHAEQHRARPGVNRNRRARPRDDREGCEQQAGAHERRGCNRTRGNPGQLSTDHVAADAVEECSERSGERCAPDADAGRIAAGEHCDAHESGEQSDRATLADVLAIEGKCNQSGEHDRRGVGDGADACGCALCRPGEQRERNRRIDGRDEQQRPDMLAGEVPTAAPQHGQQDQCAESQPDLHERQRAEFARRHAHEQKRRAPDRAEQRQLQRREPARDPGCGGGVSGSGGRFDLGHDTNLAYVRLIFPVIAAAASAYFLRQSQIWLVSHGHPTDRAACLRRVRRRGPAPELRARRRGAASDR